MSYRRIQHGLMVFSGPFLLGVGSCHSVGHVSDRHRELPRQMTLPPIRKDRGEQSDRSRLDEATGPGEPVSHGHIQDVAGWYAVSHPPAASSSRRSSFWWSWSRWTDDVTCHLSVRNTTKQNGGRPSEQAAGHRNNHYTVSDALASRVSTDPTRFPLLPSCLKNIFISNYI